MRKFTFFKTMLITILMVIGSANVWGQKTYSLVTSTDDLVAGAKYLVVGYKATATTASPARGGTNPVGWYALGFQKGTGDGTNRDAIVVASGATLPTSLEIQPAVSNSEQSAVFEITLTGTSGAWVLYDAANSANLGPDKGTGANNHLKKSAAEPTFTISIASDSKATITCFGSEANTNATTATPPVPQPRNTVRFNAGANNTDPLFACYNTNNPGQNDIYLYKEVFASTDQVATPVISPTGGNVTAPVEVSITCATEDAVIYYTTDGTEPTASSNEYSIPFTVSVTTTVKTFATKAGLTDSEVTSATYTFPVEVTNIAAFLATTEIGNVQITDAVTAVYQNGQNLYVQDASGRMLVYGNTGKTFVNGDQITGLIGRYGTFNQAPQMTNPIAPDPVSGTAVEPEIFDLTNATQAADLARFVKVENVQFANDVTFSTTSTVNGTLTNGVIVRDNFRYGGFYAAGTPYTITGFINFNNGTLQLYPIAFEEYGINQVETPVISPASSIVIAPIPVTITCATEDAIIYYTLDGTTPTDTSDEYTVPFTVSETTTVKAIAIKAGMDDSDVASVTYTFVTVPQVATPVISPEGGDVTDEVEVTITCATEDAIIYYTLDGTTPTDASYEYTVPFTVSETTTVKAIAIKASMDDSEIASVTYTFVQPDPFLIEDFEISTPNLANKTSYVGAVYALRSGSWYICGVGQMTTTDRYNGNVGVRLRGNTSDTGIAENMVEMRFDKPNGIGNVSFKYGSFSTHSGGQLQVQISTDQGSTWNNVGSVITAVSWPAAGSELLTASIDVNQIGDARIRIVKASQAANTSVNIDDILITDFDGTITKVATPVILPASGTVTSPVEVSITCDTEDATIYYTLDGETPTNESFEYTVPFTVSVNTTVKAFAVKAGLEDSEVASVTYTFPQEVANIAAFLALPQNTFAKLAGDVTAIYHNGPNLYVKDDSGYLLVYGNELVGEWIPNGVTIIGASAKLGIYGGSPQATSPLAWDGLGFGGTVQPFVVELANITIADLAKYVKVEKVQFATSGTFGTSGDSRNATLTDGNIVRNNFSYTGITYDAEKYYDITGFIAYFNNVMNLYFTEIVENTENSLNDIQHNAIKMFVSNGALNVISEGGIIEIFNVLGVKIAQVNANIGITTISNLPTNQMLIVKIGNKNGKVVVR